MSRSRTIFLLLTLGIFPTVFVCAEEVILCAKVRFTEQVTPSLTDEELVFLCGDPNVPEWKDIPSKQISAHLQSFLQTRGYHAPTFVADPKTQQWVVTPGKRTLVEDVKVTGSPIELHTDQLRNIKGQPFTPQILETVESEVRERLRISGYACPIVTVTGYPETGAVRADVDSGMSHVFPDITREEIPGVHSDVLKRYQPFNTGDPFNSNLLSLARSRTSSSNTVFSNYFAIRCAKDRSSSIQHNLVSGGAPCPFGFWCKF